MNLREEQTAFERQLPDLLREHAGEHVLFKDGRPVAFFKDSDSAFNAGLEKFGLDAVFLVAPVEDPKPQPVSVSWEAGVMFG